MERWRDEHELARAEWWTLEECMRHLDISRATLYRYRAEGLTVTKHRQNGKLIAFVKRADAQRHYRTQRHAANTARFQA